MNKYVSNVLKKIEERNHSEPTFIQAVSEVYNSLHGVFDTHKQFKELGVNKIRSFGKSKHILYDLKHIFSPEEADIRL